MKLPMNRCMWKAEPSESDRFTHSVLPELESGLSFFLTYTEHMYICLKQFNYLLKYSCKLTSMQVGDNSICNWSNHVHIVCFPSHQEYVSNSDMKKNFKRNINGKQVTYCVCKPYSNILHEDTKWKVNTWVWLFNSDTGYKTVKGAFKGLVMLHSLDSTCVHDQGLLIRWPRLYEL